MTTFGAMGPKGLNPLSSPLPLPLLPRFSFSPVITFSILLLLLQLLLQHECVVQYPCTICKTGGVSQIISFIGHSAHADMLHHPSLTLPPFPHPSVPHHPSILHSPLQLGQLLIESLNFSSPSSSKDCIHKIVSS